MDTSDPRKGSSIEPIKGSVETVQSDINRETTYFKSNVSKASPDSAITSNIGRQSNASAVNSNVDKNEKKEKKKKKIELK